jgi:hypothetical protein
VTNIHLDTEIKGPFGGSSFETDACQIAHFSKSGDSKTGKNGHSSFEIREVVWHPVQCLAEFQNLLLLMPCLNAVLTCELITMHNRYCIQPCSPTASMKMVFFMPNNKISIVIVCKCIEIVQ